MREIKFDEIAKSSLYAGLEKIEKAVGSTMGAGGKVVIFDSMYHVGEVRATKDGVTVCKAISLLDKTENLACNIVKQSAINTAIEAGDGTTLSIVLGKNIADAVNKYHGKYPVSYIFRELRKRIDKICSIVEESGVPLSKELIKQVAYTSSNSDSYVTDLVVEAYDKSKEDSLVLVENSISNESVIERIDGLKIGCGFAHQIFVNNYRHNTVELHDPLILVSEMEIKDMQKLLPFLECAKFNHRPIVIIGIVDRLILDILVSNHKDKLVQICVLNAPNTNVVRRREELEDIAIATGSKFYSVEDGELIDFHAYDEPLGTCEKIICSNSQSYIILNDTNSVAAKEKAELLKERLEIEKQEGEIKNLKNRIANLLGGFTVIKVGARTDIEQREIKDRIDDAVCAVKSAKESGAVAGGGVLLKDIAKSFKSNKRVSKEEKDDIEKILDNICYDVLLSPIKRILSNAEMEDKLKLVIDEENVGIDVINGDKGNMFDMGIIDSVKVINTALRNALSSSSNLLNCDTTMVTVEFKPQAQFIH